MTRIIKALECLFSVRTDCPVVQEPEPEDNSFLIFSERLALEQKFKEWAKEYKVEDNAFEFIVFLQLNNLIDNGAIRNFLER